SVVHDGPGQELGARVVTIAVVVEQVGGGILSQNKCDAINVALGGDLVRTVLHLLLFAAETERLPYVQPSNIRSWLRNTDPGNLPVGEAGNSECAAEPTATGDLRIKDHLGGVPFALP